MKLKNIDMEEKIKALEPLLEYRDKIGYAAARNTRLLREASQEYQVRRDELIKKYGDPELDEDGNETGQVSLMSTSPNFSDFISELTPIAEIEHEVEIFKLPISDAIGTMSGQEILDMDWMFEDDA